LRDGGLIPLCLVFILLLNYSIIINGQPHNHIVPKRGIHQGDPLSPYFFIICTKAMSSMLDNSARRGAITGIPISRRGTSINHLLFADDSLLFCHANLQEWRHIQGLLARYEAASGQQPNREKTSIFFSRNTREEVRDTLSMGVGSTN